MYTIEPYKPEYREALEAICLETGLRGRRAEFFCDSEVFTQLWLSPYLDGQPQSCLVVKNRAGLVVGYLVGTIGPGYKKRVLRHTWPALLKMTIRWCSGKYRHHPPTGRFARWLLTRSWRESPTPPPGIDAHFHFNLSPEARKGVGWDLIDVFEEMLRAQGYPGWYAVVFSSAEYRNEKMYRRMGFEIGDKRRCTLFPEEVHFLTIYHRLDGKPIDRTRLGRFAGMSETAAPQTESLDTDRTEG